MYKYNETDTDDSVDSVGSDSETDNIWASSNVTYKEYICNSLNIDTNTYIEFK